MSSPSSQLPASNASSIQCNTQGIDRHTSTPDEFAICGRCQSNSSNNNFEANNSSASSYLNDYIDALQYINSCHVLINQVIQCRNPGQKVSMPQMPNFLNVLTYIAQDVNELSELKSFDSLEKIFQEMNISDATASRRTEPCVMSDKEVEAFHPPCIHAKTSVNRIPYSSTRGTGIPRRIKGANLRTNPSDKRQTSTPTWSSSDLSRLGRNKTTSSIIIQKKQPIVPPIAIWPTRDDSPDKLHAHKLALKQQVEGTSDQETVSNEETDCYVKQMLLGPKGTQDAAMDVPKGKVRKILSKTKRDYVMIKKFLKQWGIETDSLETEDDDPLILPKSNEVRKDVGDCTSNTTSQHSHRNSSIKADEETDANTVPFLPHIHHTTAKGSIASTERRRSLTFNDIVASSAGLENTFIINEQPTWPTSPSVLHKSDESDIEPDSDDLVKSRLAKSRPFQKNSAPAPYCAMPTPRDCFLAARRRKSHSDIDSEQLLAESDVDDDLFDRKKRLRSNIKFRPPALPQKILSNIGILTPTGKVKPEKERHLQELRSRLTSDIQTPLFRKPRDRKLETGDIVQLKSEFQPFEKSRSGRY